MWGWVSEVIKGLGWLLKLVFGTDKPTQRTSHDEGVPTPKPDTEPLDDRIKRLRDIRAKSRDADNLPPK